MGLQKKFLIKNYALIMASIIILILIFLFSLSTGSIGFTLSEIINSILGKDTGLPSNIILNLRLPRIIINTLVGINLALSGALLQSVMKNPLADPGLIGVSSGASFVAITIILMFPTLTKFIPIFAFIGAVLTTILIYSLAWKSGLDPIRIILAGVAINAIVGSATSTLSLLFSDKLQTVLLWINGSMTGKNMHHVIILLPYSIIGILFTFTLIKRANVLQLGDDMSKNLGYSPDTSRILISIGASFLAGISVAFVGVIGFVGLVIPHIARMIIGSDYKYLIPFSAICGAILLILADTFSRTAFSPIEIPVGIIISILGGPFFLYLLRKKT